MTCYVNKNRNKDGRKWRNSNHFLSKDTGIVQQIKKSFIKNIFLKVEVDNIFVKLQVRNHFYGILSFVTRENAIL